MHRVDTQESHPYWKTKFRPAVQARYSSKLSAMPGGTQLADAQNVRIWIPSASSGAQPSSAPNGGYIASSSRGSGTERDIQRRALEWPTQRDPGPLTSADTVPPGLGTAPAGRSDFRPGLRTPRWRPMSRI